MILVRPQILAPQRPLVPFIVFLVVAGSLLSASADDPTAHKAPNDAAVAKKTFAAAQQDLRRLIGELSSLQAEYHQPDADKKSIENRFNVAREKAHTAANQLESSATTVLMTEPDNATARQVVFDALEGAMANDDPFRTLDIAQVLLEAGSQEEQVLFAGTTAALSTSDLDAASTFLKAASAAGLTSERFTLLGQAIETERPKVEAEMSIRDAEAKADDLPRVKIETSKGPIVVELFENEAPNTVANFISLVEKHFYDGTVFHRVIPQFMAQGGDPQGTGSGGPGYSIACECELPGARKHFLGSLSMAHAGKDTGGSQFFLTFRPTEHLDGKHTVFGRVIEGLDVLPKIQRTEGPHAGLPDKIVKAEVVRKRDHAYQPEKRPSHR